MSKARDGCRATSPSAVGRSPEATPVPVLVGLGISLDNISRIDIVAGMEAAERPPTGPSLSRSAVHVLLAIGPEERHGYAIMAEVARLTGGAMRLGPGAVYTTIKRLLDDGLIEESDARPDPDMDDQRRRYYRLTAVGRAVASAEVQRFESLVQATRPWALEVRGE